MQEWDLGFIRSLKKKKKSELPDSPKTHYLTYSTEGRGKKKERKKEYNSQILVNLMKR